MDIQDLRVFVTVAEELNFRVAAEKLHMTQPPLTRHIAKLELELGTKLFTRTTRKVELTGSGVALLIEARNLIEKFEEVERNIKSIGKIKSGLIKIGVSFISFHSRIPSLIDSFREAFKGVNIELIPMIAEDQVKKLKRGDIDLGFAEAKSLFEGFECAEIERQELGFLVHQTSPLARLKSIPLKELNKATLIFHGKSESLGFQSEFHSYLQKMNVHPKIYIKKPKEGCGMLVAANKGVLLSTKNNPVMPGVVYRPMSEFNPKLKIYGVWDKENPSLALKSFVNFLEERITLPSPKGHSHFN